MVSSSVGPAEPMGRGISSTVSEGEYVKYYRCCKMALMASRKGLLLQNDHNFVFARQNKDKLDFGTEKLATQNIYF